MAFDLNDIWGWLHRLIRRVERLESGAALENSSITNGRMRFIGGQLLIDSGGQLTVVGSVDGEGDFTWTGPWTLAGPGDITGDVDWTGDVTAAGQWDLTGDMIVRSGGEITIQGSGGDVTMSSTYSAPRIQLGSTVIEGSATVLTIAAGTSAIYVGNGQIRMTLAPRVGTGLPPGTVGADPDGTLWRAS